MKRSAPDLLRAAALAGALSFALGTTVARAQTGLGLGLSVSVTDDSGRTVSLAQPARRIVTLAPNLAELVVAAGAGGQLLAVSRYSDHPPELARLPVVGDAFALNLEALSALRPDLVLVWHSGTPERQREALKALGARQGFAVYESEIRSVEGIASTLERLGVLSGQAAPGQPAATAARQLRDDWRALQQRWAGAAPVRVFYQVWDAPLMTFNGMHLVTQALHACGARTGFDGMSALTPTVNREAVLAFRPQLLLSGEGTAGQEPAALAAWRTWPQLDAVRLGQLRSAEGAVLTRMGPRFVQAAARLCETVDAARGAAAVTR